MAASTTPNARPGSADPEPLVEALMSSPVVAIVPQAGLLVAARLMAENGLRHLPVVDGTRLCGIVTEVDVLHGVMLTGSAFAPVPIVGDVCRAAPMVDRADRRSTAAARMRALAADAALVTEGDELVGIVTATDLVGSLVDTTGT